MAENSGIRWTHNTQNWWLGCVKVSDGCKHCYAETLITGRMGKPGLWGPAKTTSRQRTSAANWAKPKAWNRRAERARLTERTFSLSLGDFFEDHPQLDAIRADAWDVIRWTPFLQWQILTKRPENIRAMLPADWGNGYPNVWLGTSIEDMRVTERAAILSQIPAVVRFISYEPALGSLRNLNTHGIDWIIYGGESGPGYRKDDPEWPREMRARCRDDGVAFFYKQSAAPRTEMGIELDGERVEEYPVPRCVTSPDRYRLPNRLASGAQYYDVIEAQRNRIGADTSTTPAERPIARDRALPLFEP